MSPLPHQHTRSLHSPPELLQQVSDELGHVVAELTFYAEERIIYVRWHGHLTSEIVIAVAAASLPWLEKLRPSGLLNDKRSTTGEWDEAMAWIEFEWTPHARASGLRAFAYVFDADLLISFQNAELIKQIRRSINLRTFYCVTGAWKWLRQLPKL